MNNDNNTQATELNKFNKDIQVTISVDSIAKNLAEKISKEFQHANLLVNVIIGQALSNERMQDISRIYNAMNGWIDELDFRIGQQLFCKDDIYDYLFKPDGSRHDMGPCKIVAIDPLRDRAQIQVEYQHFERRRGVIEQETRTVWVKPTDLRELGESDLEQLARAIELAMPSPEPAEAVLS